MTSLELSSSTDTLSWPDSQTFWRNKRVYEGQIRWDTTKPNGQPRRKLDISRAKDWFGFESQTPFVEGLRRMVAWYEASLDAGATHS